MEMLVISLELRNLSLKEKRVSAMLELLFVVREIKERKSKSLVCITRVSPACG